MNLSWIKPARFHTKVLLPVISVMVLLVIIAMVLVNSRIKAQLQQQSARSLQTADSVFKNFEKIRARSLRLRFSNITSEPRYRAACLLNDPATLKDIFQKGFGGEDLGGEVVQYKPLGVGAATAFTRDQTINLQEFTARSAASVKEALEGIANTDTIRVGRTLFDIVSAPVRTPAGDDIIGALTFSLRLGDAEAQELSDMTGSGIVLLANDDVAGASLRRTELFRQCINLFGAVRADAPGAFEPMREIVSPEEHFRVLVGTIESKSGDSKIGYVLLYSVENVLAELRAVQRIIIAVSVCAIVLGTLVVSVLVRNVTRPLRQLRDTAEAVGRGDFSGRIDITSNDECGELGRVFNRMTENLQTSRQQLEETVNTLKTTQAQLVQREKLSAIGEFVAGVTHELNNPLTAVLGFSELLQQTSVDDRQKRFIERIAHSARRCQKIVQSLLSFARQQQPERKPTSLNELVEAVMEIMAYEMRTSNIEVISDLDSNSPVILADGHQIQQVFLNVVNNARQAMEANHGAGELRICSETMGGRVRVTFSDNGPGISPENLKKIFDPFFTTKEAGKGTGLGLSLCYGIIQEHGGTITARSKLGQGATFVVELPILAKSAAAAEAQSRGDDSDATLPCGGDRSVLVVDDEEGILEFISEVLRADGYVVQTAGDGEAALRELRQHEFDVVLCDWKMPGMNGQQLYSRLSEENMEACRRFVFMTGDVINTRMEAFLKEQQRPCLAKPFSISQFRSAVAKFAAPMSTVV